VQSEKDSKIATPEPAYIARAQSPGGYRHAVSSLFTTAEIGAEGKPNELIQK